MSDMLFEGFERFTKPGRSFRPKMSIRKRGQIGFNNAAIQKFGLDKFEFVILFISGDRKTMIVMFTNNKSEEGTIKLIKGKNNFAFSAQAFLDSYSIEYGEARTFDVDWKNREHAIVVKIG